MKRSCSSAFWKFFWKPLIGHTWSLTSVSPLDPSFNLFYRLQMGQIASSCHDSNNLKCLLGRFRVWKCQLWRGGKQNKSLASWCVSEVVTELLTKMTDHNKHRKSRESCYPRWGWNWGLLITMRREEESSSARYIFFLFPTFPSQGRSHSPQCQPEGVEEGEDDGGGEGGGSQPKCPQAGCIGSPAGGQLQLPENRGFIRTCAGESNTFCCILHKLKQKTAISLQPQVKH